MNGFSPTPALLAILLSALPLAAEAQAIYKCTDDNGKVTFRDSPCGDNTIVYATASSTEEDGWEEADEDVEVSDPAYNKEYYRTARNRLTEQIRTLEENIRGLEIERIRQEQAFDPTVSDAERKRGVKLRKGDWSGQGIQDKIKKVNLELDRLLTERDQLDNKEEAEKNRPLKIKASSLEEQLAAHRYQHEKDNYRLPRQRLKEQIAELERGIRAREADKTKKRKEYEEKVRATADYWKQKALWAESARVQEGLDNKNRLSRLEINKKYGELRDLNTKEWQSR